MKRNIIKGVKAAAFLLLAAGSIYSCKLFESFDEDDKGSDAPAGVQTVRLSKAGIALKAGELTYVTFTAEPSNISFTPEWFYDSSIISVQAQGKGAIIKGLAEGQSSLTVKAQDRSDSCIVTVAGYADNYVDTTEPYIYSSTTIKQMQPGDIETVYVSLYNGTAADIDGYTWNIDKPEVADINPNGQYCTITAKETGYTRIKVSHSKSAYPYYMGLYVLQDTAKTTYITTEDNIVAMTKNGDGQTVKVKLANPPEENYQSGFSWEILSSDPGIEGYNASAVTITANADKCVVTPQESGLCTLRVIHPNALYPLDITIRVVEIIKNVYIEPSATVVTLSGSSQAEVSSILKGLTEGSEYSVDDFSYVIDGKIVGPEFNHDAVAAYASGKSVFLTGKKNGSASMLIRHPSARNARQVLLIITGQTTDAVDVSYYITTSQNYVKTAVGSDPTTLNIMLKGGIEGDEKDFSWSVKQTPWDGVSDVIRLTTENGSTDSSLSRAADTTYAYGSAVITPLKEGTATIKITHPKVYYPTEILVKVLPAGSVVTEPLYFSGDAMVKFLNSETYDYSIALKGYNKQGGDENSIAWSTESSSLRINANADKAQFASTGSGSCVSTVTVRHPKVQNEHRILVLTADTEEELAKIKALYADKYYYALNKGKSQVIYVSTTGFEDEMASGSNPYALLSWTSSDPAVCSVERNVGLSATITGNSAGSAKITAAMGTYSVTFTVTVYPEGVNIDQVDPAVYFTTTKNVYVFNRLNTPQNVSVTAIGLDPSEYGGITWTSSDPSVISAIGNGINATLEALKEGEATITVSHPLCENRLKLYVRAGSEYVIKNDPVIYISTSLDTISLVRTDSTMQLTASLVNASTEEAASGYSFSIEDSTVAEITASYANGKCFIKPVSAGQTQLTVSHPAAKYTKIVPVIIGYTQEEVDAFRYLTTASNIITVSEGSSKPVSVSVKNSSDVILTGYSWSSDDPTIADVSSSSSASAVIKGNKTGTTRIYCRNTQCMYPLEMIAQVVDPVAASANPYIQVNSTVINLTVSSSWTNLTAELVGGSDSDAVDFSWVPGDTSIIEAYGQNGIGKIRAKAKGIAYLTVRHPKAALPQQILCICDEAVKTDCSISVSSGNIMSIKPNTGDTTISATLVNGTAADRNNFVWSLDVYDIVDLVYSANTATVTPLKEGTCTLTVHHPKSPYDQKVVIKVQQYDSFGFSSDSKKITEGKTAFISMQVPSSSVKTHVEYSSYNTNVCQISGTNSVCQLTGTGTGTTTVHAKLIATKTSAVLSESDMLVYVEKAADNPVYITGSPTIYTIEKDTSKVLKAELVGAGVSILDQRNLRWKSSDPNIVKLTGVSSTGTVTGDTVSVTAVSEGEATLTISHDKTNTDLVYYIIVPGRDAADIALNKSYVRLEKGKSSEVSASVTNGTNADYKSIVWTADESNGNEIVRVLGSGKSVSLYAIHPGTTYVHAQLPSSGAEAKVQVIVEDKKQFTFERSSVRIQPGKSKEVKYTVRPSDAAINWTYQSSDAKDHITYEDKGNTDGNGTLTITGVSEGNCSVIASTSEGSVATLSVICAWDYVFKLNRYKLTGTPDDTYSVDFEVSPIDAKITADDCGFADINIKNNQDGTGTITFQPTSEGTQTGFTVYATNPANNQQIGACTVALEFKYPSVHVIPKVVSTNGNYSYYDEDTGIIHMGDGETMIMQFAIKEDKANASINSIQITNVNGNNTGMYCTQLQSAGNNIWSITHPQDYINYQYRITAGYKVIWDGSREIPMDTMYYRHIRRGRSDDYWGLWSDVAGGYIFYYYDEIDYQRYYQSTTSWDYQTLECTNLDGSRVSVQRDPSLDGRIYSESAFLNTPLFYCPGGEYGTHSTAKAHAQFNTEFVQFVHETSSNKALVSTGVTNMLVVNVNHNGKVENVKINIVTDVRYCSKNQ